MQKRLATLLSGAIFLSSFLESPLQAEDKIRTFVNRNGKLVFTNLLDQAPVPEIAAVAPDHSATIAQPSPQPPVTVQDRLAHEVPENLRALVDTISAKHGVDPALVRAVIKTESNFDRWAVSHKGAMGLMQLIPATARRFGVTDPYNPQQNIDGGVRYLKFLLDKFDGNLDLALAGYNAGENLVARLGRVPAINETTNYVRKIRGIYKRPSIVKSPAATAGMEAPKAVEIPKEEAPKIYRTVDSRGVVHFSNVGPPN